MQSTQTKHQIARQQPIDWTNQNDHSKLHPRKHLLKNDSNIDKILILFLVVMQKPDPNNVGEQQSILYNVKTLNTWIYHIYYTFVTAIRV